MRCLIFIALVVASAIAQTPAAPSFEVATIRPSPLGAKQAEIAAGNLTLRNLPLNLIAWAYGVQTYQVLGLPGALNNTRFEVAAKAATPAPESELRLMLQNLLAERFKLKLHREKREMSALVLTVPKNGHKLRGNNVEGSPSFTTGAMNLTGVGATIGQMTDFLSREVQIPVVDQTGLTGRYNYHLDIRSYVTDEIKRNADKGVPIEGPGIMAAAIQEQLGLKVDSGKVPLEVIVVDSIEKTPTEN
jgi:uncharacterized protein (TIGR03435 family)